MRAASLVAILTAFAVSCGLTAADPSVLKEGDIVYQTSRSSQSQAIQLATHSEYSHMGILFQKEGQWVVLEAVQPVKWTPLKRWIERGLHGHVVIKRLKNRDARLTTQVLARMKQAGQRYLGRPYDLTFEWSDDRIYCSELVWKIYQEGAGIEIGALQTLRDFDLTHPAVQAKLLERYQGRPPLAEPVISPNRMFESPELETILKQ